MLGRYFASAVLLQAHMPLELRVHVTFVPCTPGPPLSGQTMVPAPVESEVAVIVLQRLVVVCSPIWAGPVMVLPSFTFISKLVLPGVISARPAVTCDLRT